MGVWGRGNVTPPAGEKRPANEGGVWEGGGRRPIHIPSSYGVGEGGLLPPKLLPPLYFPTDPTSLEYFSGIYKSKYGLRMEDRISNLKVYGLGFGKAVERKYRIVGKDVGPGYVNEGEFTAPLYEQAVRRGLMIRSKP